MLHFVVAPVLTLCLIATMVIMQGGMVIVAYQHGGCYTSDVGHNVAPSQVEEYAEEAFRNTLAGVEWSTDLDPNFVMATRQLNVGLFGGNPEAHLPTWTKTVPFNPVPLQWTYTPITNIVPVNIPPSAPQEALSAFLHNAIAEFDSGQFGA